MTMTLAITSALYFDMTFFAMLYGVSHCHSKPLTLPYAIYLNLVANDFNIFTLAISTPYSHLFFNSAKKRLSLSELSLSLFFFITFSLGLHLR